MSSLFDTYHPDSSSYHEVFAKDGSIHPHWQHFASVLQSMSPEQMQARSDLVSQQIQENGVTYNVYGEKQGLNRPWRLGAIPNLIPAEEWQVLADGIAQRAKLLNLILADIYGEQHLIKQGLLPAELIYGHNNFLRPCIGLKQAQNIFLHIYAADVARDDKGQWWVMADRTQTPSGAGYALENRQIISRVFPEVYRQLKVQSLNDYFVVLKQTLMRLSPSLSEPPLIVLLTAGRFNETYFEHIYLARHLGIPLVEGADLIVRAGIVYLKTLNGLNRVHGILRRLDDDYCDPLAFRSDSALGVAGLLAAVRAGNVLVANALGSGVIESAGLLGFLPKICKHLLGEPLKIPSVATWWCGETPVLEKALINLDSLIVKPSFPSQRFEPVFVEDLDEAQKELLKKRLRSRSYAYVAQEKAVLAQTPVWDLKKQQLISQSSAMRIYATPNEKGQYQVMAGGLARVAKNPQDAIVSMQRGGISKDVWVCFGQNARSEKPKMRTLGARDLLRQDPYLSSRVAENMFWLGRYSERCANNARLLHSTVSRYIDLPDDNDPVLQAALASCEYWGLCSTEKKEPTQQLLAGIYDKEWAGSVASNLHSLIWSASQVRGRLSQENWITITELQQEADGLVATDLGKALSFVDRLLMSLSALSGVVLDDMVQDHSWRFLMMGRRLERLQFFSQIISQLLQQSFIEQSALDWLLELAESTITYRSRYVSSSQLIPVLDLVLLDTSNPHSIQFQINALLHSLKQLAHESDCGLTTFSEQLQSINFDVLESEMNYPSRLNKALALIARLLQDIAQAGRNLASSLELRYFAHIDTFSQSTVSS
jgi:uncharacterized circularly permuted ATP-grasp superfamily protein/uncharacterized alpha-E superfamily protein